MEGIPATGGGQPSQSVEQTVLGRPGEGSGSPPQETEQEQPWKGRKRKVKNQ